MSSKCDRGVEVMIPKFRKGSKTRFIMTEDEKNDLKVPWFDGLNKTLSRHTRITVSESGHKLLSVTRWRSMAWKALPFSRRSTTPSRARFLRFRPHCILSWQRKRQRLLLPSSRWCKRMKKMCRSRCMCGCVSILFATSRSPTVSSSSTWSWSLQTAPGSRWWLGYRHQACEVRSFCYISHYQHEVFRRKHLG